MTLPSSNLRMDQVASELNRSLPLSLLDQWVQYLANSAPPISMSMLFGKTGRFDGSRTGSTTSGPYTIDLNGVPFFTGTFTYLTVDTTPGSGYTQLVCGPNCSWPGNVFVKNNSTGVAVTLPKTFNAPAIWQSTSNPSNLIRDHVTDSFTIVPSF